MTAQIFNFEEEKKKRMIFDKVFIAKILMERQFLEQDPESWKNDPLHPYNWDKE